MRSRWQVFGQCWGGIVLLSVLVIRSETCITTTTTYVDVAQGSDLVLVCAGTAPVSWSDHTAVSSQREVITNPSNNAGEQRSWLIYRNAANSGSAITCSTGNGSCINYAVKVFTIPSDVDISVESSGLTSNTVLPGRSATLSCFASGTAPLQYQWYHNGTTIPGASSSHYTINSVQFSSAGVYTCEVSNWAGRSRGRYTLKVQENPTITSLTSSALSNKVILPRTGFDQSLSFECAVSRGSHPVTFQWSHNGGSVQGSFTSTRFSGNNFIGQLHISRLTPSHNGQYTCSTQNTVGHSSSRIFVTVVDPPVANVNVNGTPVNQVVQALSGTTSQFQCLASGSYPLSATWFISLDTTNTTYVATANMMLELTHRDEGNYTCIVENRPEGLTDQYSVIVQVYDQIHAISSTASLERMENASVTMSCVFFKDPQDPDPFPQVTWTGPSYHSVETAPRMTSYDRYQSSITFTAKREHYGIFTCSVNDVGVGIINMTISLNIYYVPEAVDSDSIQVISKAITSATVEWTQTKDTHYSILYYHLRLATCPKCHTFNTFKTVDNATAYILDNLIPFSVYSLQVAAENSVGIGPYSEPVMVQSDKEMVTIIIGSGSAFVIAVVAVVILLVVIGCSCKCRKKRRKQTVTKKVERAEEVLDIKDPHYAALDMGTVEGSEGYTSLTYAGPKPKWEEDANSVREYTLPPDAIPKPVNVSSDTAKTGAVTIGASSKSAITGKTTVPVGQVAQKDKKAGKKKALLPKAPGGKKATPLAVPNPTTSNKKEDSCIQSAVSTTTSSGMSSVPPPAITEAKQTDKKKQPLSVPVSLHYKAATKNAVSGGSAPGKVSVAQLAKCLEKGEM